jgi:glucose-1-phosphate cytidylyltransferase
MKVVILAGGLGSRISEFTDKVPKPMIKIGPFPIIWHIMKLYSYYGLNEFIICLGYRSDIIKDYFVNYKDKINSLFIDTKTGQKISSNKNEDWKIHLIETGEKTTTGSRIKRIQHLIEEDNFCMTYGDGLANVNIKKLIKFHQKNKAVATLTAVRPPERFGIVKLDKKFRVLKFSEKPIISTEYINGGFFVLSKNIFKYLNNDKTIFEKKPLERLSKNRKLMAFRHNGFWQCMDNLRDWELLNKWWGGGLGNNAPWKIWK